MTNFRVQMQVKVVRLCRERSAVTMKLQQYSGKSGVETALQELSLLEMKWLYLFIRAGPSEIVMNLNWAALLI